MYIYYVKMLHKISNEKGTDIINCNNLTYVYINIFYFATLYSF